MLIPLHVLTSLVVVMADGISKMSWCYIITTNCLIYYMADVIAMWHMEWPLQGWSVGICYSHVADRTATGSVYFKFWGVKQNLIPYVRHMVFALMFLLRDGLLTLIYKASLMVLMNGSPYFWKRFVDGTFTILRVITKKSLPGSHQLYWPAYPLYLWRTKRRWIHTLPWHISNAQWRWKPQ